MRKLLGVLALFVVPALAGCGAGTGADSCELYAEEMRDDPAAITSVFVMPQIEEALSDMDDPTRRAFAALVTAADDFGGDPNAEVDAAAEVRTVCLSEHGVEVPS